MRMMEAPTTWEWTFVYAPAGFVLVIAGIRELLSGLISKWLSVATLFYFLGARFVHSPTELGWYLLSFLLSAVVAIGFGWSKGYAGGGVAKLTVAVCSGLPPWMALCVACGCVFFAVIVRHTHRWHGVESVPGSIVLASMLMLTVASAAAFGHGGIA
jgi:hypothetical protein